MNAGELSLVRRAFDGLNERALGGEGNKRKWEETRMRLEECYGKLEAGEVSPTVQGKVVTFAQALENGDVATLTKIKTEKQTWDRDNNKAWIMAMKLIFPKI